MIVSNPMNRRLRMRQLLCLVLALVAAVGGAETALAQQETPSAKGTRKMLQKVIDVDQKEVGTKDFLSDITSDLDNRVKFIIDNASGVSNNTKMSYKAKGVTVEKMLNDLADKYDWGWYVVSNEGNNKVDGKVMIRKNTKVKERGYEAGKEPKKTSSLEIDRVFPELGYPAEVAATSPRFAALLNESRVK